MGDKRASDEELFRQAIGEAVPLRQRHAEPFTRRPPPHPRAPRPGEQDAEPPLVDLAIETGDELEFVRPGVQRRLFAELRRGRLAPEDSLDLHGLRVVEARETLAAFLRHARAQRMRVVHIVHGKGRGSDEQQPILKQKVNQWLRQPPEVLAFCSAARFDGGLGAVYVLLSRKRTPGS